MSTFDAPTIGTIDSTLGAVGKILVLVDFSRSSDAALHYALEVADACGAEVEVLHVWCPRRTESRASTIFAETRDGIAMEHLLSAAECQHVARVCGRLEFGDEASNVILDILGRERFDLVVMGLAGRGRDWAPTDHDATDHDAAIEPAHESGHVTARVTTTSACKVITMPPGPLAAEAIVAA